MTSMQRARRNTRCSPRCCRELRAPRCSSRIAKLGGDATPLGVAHAALAQAADGASAEKIDREFFDLFIGVGRGELLAYGS